MAASSGPSAKLLMDWEVLIPSGPSLAFHVGCILRNSVYIHGGITTKDSTIPSDKLYRLDLTSMIWNEVRQSGSPARSHHVCVPLQDRYMLVIGGWTGKNRVSDITIFDVEKQIWMYPKVSGFPEDAGLSSHTATLLQNGDILVLGREGSLRMQRRHGNAYMLSGSVESGSFRFVAYSQQTSSRSGHTANCLGSTLVIVGGRSDNLVELHQGYPCCPSVSGPATTKIVDATKFLKPMAKPPCGRKNHCAISCKGALFIYGGETFDGRSRDPVGDLIVMTYKSPVVEFYKVGVSSVGRAGHVCCVVGDRIIMHGGIGGRNVVMGGTYELHFT